MLICLGLCEGRVFEVVNVWDYIEGRVFSWRMWSEIVVTFQFFLKNFFFFKRIAEQ